MICVAFAVAQARHAASLMRRKTAPAARPTMAGS
jgi:hypothetical protein